MKGATGQYMQVQVEYGLTGSSAVVNYQAKIIITLLFGHFTGFDHQMPQYMLVRLVGFGQFGKRLFWNQQYMQGRLRLWRFHIRRYNPQRNNNTD